MMKIEKNHVSHLESSKESYSMIEKTGEEMMRTGTEKTGLTKIKRTGQGMINTGTEKTGLTKSVKNAVMMKPV
tara:strand:+ start:5106 stop:5324 length:219 start_codon:yes stop_codon:yes gene_type:complete